MKKLVGSLLGSILLLSNTAVAQTPVEFYGCKLKDGKSMSDAMGQDIKNYFASKKASKLDETWPAECEMHTLWMSRQIREAS